MPLPFNGLAEFGLAKQSLLVKSATKAMSVRSPEESWSKLKGIISSLSRLHLLLF